MYISKIELKNIKCFENVSIELVNSDNVTRGCVILGDNGMGKTTILRSIAMSLSGESSAAGLLDQIEGGWIRNDVAEGHVILTLRSDDGNNEYIVKTEFAQASGGDEIINSQVLTPNHEDFWDKIFVAGYGAPRGVVGETQYDAYTVYDALFTLFAQESGYLQNPELNIRRIKDALKTPEKLVKILNWVDSILMLPKGSLELQKGGLFLKDRWGNPMPIRASADGYKSVTTVICDLLGWFLLYDEDVFNKELSGIVIIDELEQHLHPIWQRKIVNLLMNAFPMIQFIITTHSPLVAGNAGRLHPNDSGLKLFHTNFTNNNSQVSVIEENLGDLGYDQILSSEAFGHLYNINSEVEEVLSKASALASKDNRTEEEEIQYVNFKSMLKNVMFPRGKTQIERIVEKEYYQEIEKKISEFKKIISNQSNDKNK
jgi:predicted ATPase